MIDLSKSNSVEPSAFTDPDAAARRLVEIASTVEAVQDGRIYIELVNRPFLTQAARRINSVPHSHARSRWAGCRGTKGALTSNSHGPVLSYLLEASVVPMSGEIASLHG